MAQGSIVPVLVCVQDCTKISRGNKREKSSTELVKISLTDFGWLLVVM